MLTLKLIGIMAVALVWCGWLTYKRFKKGTK